MLNGVNDKSYLRRFGQVAIEKNFVTPEQVKEALIEQIEDNLAQKPHRALGKILIDKGWMNAGQVEAVLIEAALDNIMSV